MSPWCVISIYNLNQGNTNKTNILVVSNNTDKDENLKKKLANDDKTNRVRCTILPLETYVTAVGGAFKDDNSRKRFLDKVENEIKPTLILIPRPNEYNFLRDTLKVNHLIGPVIDRSSDYLIFESRNITVTAEPVLLTYSVMSKVDHVGDHLKKMLKDNAIPNRRSTRVLWIDGSHGEKENKDGKIEGIGGLSGLSKEKYLNSHFYERACEDVGLQANPSPIVAVQEDGKEKGNFIRWVENKPPKPDIRTISRITPCLLYTSPSPRD